MAANYSKTSRAPFREMKEANRAFTYKDRQEWDHWDSIYLMSGPEKMEAIKKVLAFLKAEDLDHPEVARVVLSTTLHFLD